MKSLYTLQPYQVGSKYRKSLAVIIPAEVTKQYNIDKPTVFTLHVDDDKKRLMLQTIDKVIPVSRNKGLIISVKNKKI